MYPSSESPNRLDRSLFLAENCSFGLEISEYPYPSSEPVWMRKLRRRPIALFSVYVHIMASWDWDARFTKHRE